MSAKVYYEKDANLSQLKGKKICVIGYGSQGRAHALNMHESGLSVTVGVRAGGKSAKAAQADGLSTQPLAEAVKDADVIMFLVPDPVQPAVYHQFVEPVCRPGLTLMFAHGFNVHYGQIVPPPEVDVIMVAPKGPGKLVRDLYVAGQGVPCLVAIEQDASGQALKNGLAYALAIGGARAGVIETSFKEETETDLFGEQAVLCGGLSALLKTGFEILVEAGYAPEMAYFECVNELKLIIDLIYQGGLKHMRHFISDTAKWGDITCGPKVIDEHVRANMKKLLDDIQSGVFAREWVLENQANRPVYRALLKREAEHPVEEVGARLRSMMKWLD